MVSYDGLSTVAVTISDHIAILSLNIPETGNAFNGRMHDEVTEAFYLLNEDRDVNVIVLTGAGSEFCGGGDAPNISEDPA